GAEDVRAYRLALIGTGHRKNLVGRNTEVVRPKPNKTLDEADVRGDGGLDADFGLVLNKQSRQLRLLVLLILSRPRVGSLRIPGLFPPLFGRPPQHFSPPLPLPSPPPAQLFPSPAVQRGTRRRHAPPARCWADSPPQRVRRQAVRGRPAMRRADRLRSRRLNRRPVRNRTDAMRVLLQVSGRS